MIKLTHILEANIPKPIQSLIDNMVANKIQRHTVKIKNKSKHTRFMKDVKPAIDSKLLMIKHNPIDNSEMWISLGSKAQSMMEGEPLTEAPSVISMKEAEKVWDALVKKFSDNKNDSIEYLNKDRTYRNMAIKAIFTATKF